MKNGYKYLQPNYIGKFKCDGRICPANCCCRDWQIVIDEETFKKYSELESSEHELTKNFSPNKEVEGFLINHAQGDPCPFMTKEGLCKIQLEHGEKFLSQTCMSYPRQLVNFGDLIERSLTPTCPLAADLILNSEKIKFELSPVKLPEWAHGKLFVGEVNVPKNFFPHILEIQLTAISLLQEKRLNLDEKIIVLGFYLFQLEDMQIRDELNLIPTLNKIYTSEEFFTEQIPTLLHSVNFQILEFAENFFGLLKNIYGDKKILKTEGNQKYVDVLFNAMNFNPDEDLDLQELAENFFDLKDIKKIFLQEYQTFFENYLVNDFFGGVYPFKVEGSIQNNFAVFVATFKILENIALAIFAASRDDEKKIRAEIFKMICDMSMDLNHNSNYLAAITEFFKDKCDIRFFMRSFLGGV